MRPQLDIRTVSQGRYAGEQRTRILQRRVVPLGQYGVHYRPRLVGVRRASDVGDHAARPDRGDRRVEQLLLQRPQFDDVIRRTTPACLRPTTERAESAAWHIHEYSVKRPRRPGRLGAVADQNLVVAGDRAQVGTDEVRAMLERLDGSEAALALLNQCRKQSRLTARPRAQ